jgi:ATP-dependent DNA helicase RecG
MFDEMRIAGLTAPLYQETPGSVRLILATLPAVPALDNLRAEYSDIVRTLQLNGPMSTGDIASHLAVSRPTAIRWLRDLEKRSLVIWRGNSLQDPTAVWMARIVKTTSV